MDGGKGRALRTVTKRGRGRAGTAGRGHRRRWPSGWLVVVVGVGVGLGGGDDEKFVLYGVYCGCGPALVVGLAFACGSGDLARAAATSEGVLFLGRHWDGRKGGALNISPCPAGTQGPRSCIGFSRPLSSNHPRPIPPARPPD